MFVILFTYYGRDICYDVTIKEMIMMLMNENKTTELLLRHCYNCDDAYKCDTEEKCVECFCNLAELEVEDHEEDVELRELFRLYAL